MGNIKRLRAMGREGAEMQRFLGLPGRMIAIGFEKDTGY